MRSAFVLLVAMAASLPAIGCREFAPFHAEPMPTTLPNAERKLPAPDVSALPLLPASGSLTPPPIPGYYRLTAEECRSLACQNSSIANLMEAGVTVRTGPLASVSQRTCADWVRVVTVKHLSQETRNRTAGAALKLYYQLLEYELKADVLTASVAELDELIKSNEKLQARGFKETVDAFELSKQRLELVADQARLRAGLQKINSELKSLLAIDPNTQAFLLPDDLVRVVPDPIDPEQAVQLGLMIRADLNLIRSLIAMLDHRTLAAVRKVLTGITPILAAVQSIKEHAVPQLSSYVSVLAKAEATATQRQLNGLLKDREREAIQEIRSAVDAWASARDMVAIGRRRFELNREHVVELEKKSKAGFGVELELRKARLDTLKAEADLVTDIVKWKLADVKAREVIGLLCTDEPAKSSTGISCER